MRIAVQSLQSWHGRCCGELWALAYYLQVNLIVMKQDHGLYSSPVAVLRSVSTAVEAQSLKLIRIHMDLSCY